MMKIVLQLYLSGISQLRIFIFRWNLMCSWSTHAIRLKMAPWFRRNSAVFWTATCFGNTCGRWSTSYRDILAVETVVTAPAVVWTRHNVCFWTATGNFIQPYPSATSIDVSKRVSVVTACNHQPQMNLYYKWHIKLETKASSHEGQCIPAGYCHAHMVLYESGVNYNVNGKYTKYNRTTMRPNFYVLEYFHHTLATLVAPSTDGTAKCLVRYKEHLVL